MESRGASVACSGQTALFYPPDGERRRARRRREREAKRLCTSCAARVPCLALALENRETDGIWGGFNEDERAMILRNQGAA